MNIVSRKNVLCLGALSLVLLFSGCDLFKGCGCSKEKSAAPVAADSKIDARDSSEVLLKIKGKPVITVKKFEDHFNQILDANPQMKQVLPFIPDAEKNAFGSLVIEEVLLAWLKDKGIDQTDEFKKELDETLDKVKRNIKMKLAAKHIEKESPVKISDSDVKKHYEENKKVIPGLMVAPGGVKAEGVMFNDKDKAKEFLAEAKKDFKDAAKKKNLTVKDFDLVHEMSMGMDKDLKEKILEMKKVPATELFEVDKKFWVIYAEEKQEEKYHPYEMVKGDLKNMLKGEKVGELLDKKIKEFKKNLDVEENLDHFDKKKKDPKPELASLLKGMNTDDSADKKDSGAKSA